MSLLEFLFGRPKTPPELLLQYKPALNIALCNLDTERLRFDELEKIIRTALKRVVRQNELHVVRPIAEDCVRVRKILKMIITLQEEVLNVYLRIESLTSSKNIIREMNVITGAIEFMTKTINHPIIQGIIQTYDNEIELIKANQEIELTNNESLLEDDDKVEGDALVAKVSDEPDENASNKLKEFSSTGETSNAEPEVKGPITDTELETRLQNLRKDMYAYLLYTIKDPSTNESAGSTKHL